MARDSKIGTGMDRAGSMEIDWLLLRTGKGGNQDFLSCCGPASGFTVNT